MAFGPHATEDEPVMGWNSGNGEYNWKGVCLWDAFWLPKEGANLNPQDLPNVLSPSQNDLLGNVELRVHTVPKEVQDWDAQAILEDFVGLGGQSRKEIEFNGHPALLIEDDFDDQGDDEGHCCINRCSYKKRIWSACMGCHRFIHNYSKITPFP
jgi:hypothetical protein